LYKTANALDQAVRKYFVSISTNVTVKEEFDTGQKDEFGHAVKDFRDALNGAGEPVRRTVYIVPPTVSGLCVFLGIHRSTWYEYQKTHPFDQVCEWVRLRILAYLESELLTRKGSEIQGVKFLLQSSYGMTEHKTLELGPMASAAVASATMGHAEKLELLEELKRQADVEG